MPYRDKEKQKEAQRLWAQKQPNERKRQNYLKNKDNKKLMVEKFIFIMTQQYLDMTI
jgi:hypothetical protein